MQLQLLLPLTSGQPEQSGATGRGWQGLQKERRHQLGTLFGAGKWEDRRDKGQEVMIVLETQSAQAEQERDRKPGAGQSSEVGIGEMMF